MHWLADGLAKHMCSSRAYLPVLHARTHAPTHACLRADVDGDGLIDYNEFVAATMHLSKLEKEELLQNAFKQIDKVRCAGAAL